MCTCSFLAHERIAVIHGRCEGLLDSALAGPAHEVECAAGLVIGTAGTAAAEGLLAHYRTGGLVVDVEIARGMGERH